MTIKSISKYVASLALRILLVTPFIILASVFAAAANLFDGIARMFEDFANGLLNVVRSLKSFTRAPYVKDWNDKIETLAYEEKMRVLRELRKDE